MNIMWRTVGLAALLNAGCSDGVTDEGTDLTAAKNDMAAGCPAEWLLPPGVDPSIAVPADGSAVVLHARAVGTQNYVCMSANVDGGGGSAGPAWTLVAPAATLQDCAGATIGSHSAPSGATSPQWANDDGSVIVGRKTAAFAVGAAAIPWLLLSATSHSGTGITATRVAYVQRLNTAGGVASDPCDVAHDGATSNVPYSADYYFFGK